MILFVLKNSWSYKWTCGDEAKCQRIHNDSLVTDETAYNSQNACRLVCGRYGGLWPRPTSFVLLGQTLITFNPNNLRFFFGIFSFFHFDDAPILIPSNLQI